MRPLAFEYKSHCRMLAEFDIDIELPSMKRHDAAHAFELIPALSGCG